MSAASPLESIIFVAYPGMTALDLVGPHHMLAGLTGARLSIATLACEPVTSDMGLTIIPDLALEDCVPPDLIIVPGGTEGTLLALRNCKLITEIQRLGQSARLVASVCTGSVILAAAGLLYGRRATSHFLTRDLLADAGAIVVNERIVWDGAVVTAAGVTAGMDLGLAIVQRWRGGASARMMALVSEYLPDPPVDAGTPERAGPETTAALLRALNPWVQEMREALATSSLKRQC